MKLLNVIIFAETFRLMLLLLFYVVQWSPNDFIFHKNSRENTQKLVFAKVGPESAKFFSSFSLSCFCSRSLFLSLSLSLSQSLLIYLLFTLTSSLSFSHIVSFSFTLSLSYIISLYLELSLFLLYSFFFSYLPSLSLTLSPFILLSLPLSLSLSRKQVNIFQPKPFFPKLFESFSLSHPSLGPNQAGSSNPLREMASSSNCILIKLATLMDVRRVKKVKKWLQPEKKEKLPETRKKRNILKMGGSRICGRTNLK